MKKWQWILLATGLLALSYLMARMAHHAPEHTGIEFWHGCMSFLGLMGALLCVAGAGGAFKN